MHSTGINWDAVAAVATLLATIVALLFGLKDVLVALLTKQQRQARVATSLIHPVQVAKNQVVAISEVLAADKAESHRPRLNDLGSALLITPLPSIARYGIEVEIFGQECASAYCYAMSLLEDIASFADWLRQIEPPNEEQWRYLKEQFSFERECANQAA